MGDEAVEEEIALMQEVVKASRSTRMTTGMGNKTKPDTFIFSTDQSVASRLRPLCGYVTVLANLGSCQVIEDDGSSDLEKCMPSIVNSSTKIYTTMQDVDSQKQVAQLQKNRKRLVKAITNREKRMSGAKYASKTPKDIQEK